MKQPEHILQDRLQAVQAVYGDARQRNGAPWKHLDRRSQAITLLAGRTINADWANRSPAEKTSEYSRVCTELDNAEAEFIRWRDMPAEELSGASAVAGLPLTTAPVQPADLARSLLDGLHQRGVRLELGSKDRISARPAHLLTTEDKRSLIALKGHVAALWKERNDVWVVE